MSIWPEASCCGGTSDLMLTWPDIWPNTNLTWSLIPGGYIWPEVDLTWSLTKCQHDLKPHLGGTSDHRSMVAIHLATRCFYLGRVRLTFCLIGSQPASQLANCNWSANQPCDKISTSQALGWSDSWWQKTGGLTTLAPVQGPSTPTSSPWGSDLPDQGQASDTNELCSPLYTICSTFRDHLQFCIYII